MLDKKSYVYLRFIVLTLLVIGGLAWGTIGVTGSNPIARVTRILKIPYLSRVIYTMVGIAALIFIMKFYNRDTFLPFLGKTVFPPTLLNLGHPIDYNRQATLKAPSEARFVVFWAAEGSNNDTDVKEAYGKFLNSGAVQVEDGEAVIRFRDPVSYTVHGKKKLKKHVHYRWLDESGMMSKVHTLEVQ